MSELTDINAIFHEASDAFGPITEKTRDSDLQRLNEMLVVCTLSVTLTGSTAGCASGVHLVESLEVGITRLLRDGAKRAARLLEDDVDVGEFGHAEGGKERAARGPFYVTEISKL